MQFNTRDLPRLRNKPINCIVPYTGAPNIREALKMYLDKTETETASEMLVEATPAPAPPTRNRTRTRPPRSRPEMRSTLNTSLLVLIITILKLCLVQVSEANLPPYFTADLNNHIIIENTPVGTPIYTLQGVDPERSEVRYGIMGTDKLSVDEETGVVTVAKPIDRELSNTLKVTVTVEDVVDMPGQENNLVKLPVSVIIQDLNDNAPKFENKDKYETLEVMEDTEVGSGVLDINISDPDLIGVQLKLNCTSTSQSPEACDVFPIRVQEATAGRLQAVMRLGEKLDYNRRSLYQFVLTATDGEHISRAAVVIRVKDVQNTPPVFIGSMSGRVLEDARVGTLVMVLQARDGDLGKPRDVKLTLLSNPGDAFLLEPETGRLVTGKPLDRETLGTVLTMQVKAQELPRSDEPIIASQADIDILETIANITVLIDDIQDEKPTFSSHEYWVEIEENTPVGTPLPDLDMFVQDKDSGTFADFTLRIDGPLAELFDIEPKFASGSVRPTVRVKKAFDYENPNERKFLILVVAQNVEEPELFSAATIYLTVQDLNDNKPKFEKEFYVLPVMENAAPGTKIGQITAYDPDSNEFGNLGLVYQIVGTGSKKFSVNATTGEITVAECATSGINTTAIVTVSSCLDYETQKSYDLLYMASDSYKQEGFVHSIIPLKIILTDANDNAPFYTNKFHRMILENTAHFDPRFFIKAQDVDEKALLMYKIVESSPPIAEKYFKIDGATAEFEIFSQTLPPNNYSFVVQASDGLFHTNATVIVNVTDINNNNPVFNSTLRKSIQLLENTSLGTVILQLQATDEDLDANGEIYYVLNSGSFGYFELDALTGEISLVKELDSLVKERFELSVSAVDRGTPQLRSDAIIHIRVYSVFIDLPKITPEVQRVQVSESTKIGEVIAQISTNFVDSFNSSVDELELKFEFVEPMEGRNSDNKLVQDIMLSEWFTITNDGSVIATHHLIREMLTTANLTVMLTSERARPGSKSYGTLLLTIFEVNDYPPRIEDVEIETYEELPPGMPILSMIADDPEGRQISNYFIGQGEEYVSIDNKTGDIRVAGRLDYENNPVINFTVVAVDSGVPQLSSTGTIMLALLNINDNAPEFNQTTYEAELDEHSPEGTYVASVHATDADGDVISYELESGELSSAFKIDRVGKVTVSKDGKKLLDRENMNTAYITLGVRAKDPEYSGFATIRVHVRDINDMWPVFKMKNYHSRVYAPLQAGEEILKVIAHGGDSDGTDELTFKIYSGNDLGLFEVDKKTGVIRATRAHELTGEVRLVVQVNDKSGNGTDHFDRTGVYIQIFPGNFRKPEFKFPNRVNSTLPAIESDMEEIKLFKQGNFTKVLGHVMAVDTDEGEAGRIQYYFKEGENLVTETLGLFRIETNSGKIIQISPLDREAINRYNLVVVAKDGGRPVSAETIAMLTIDVTDIDDHKAIFVEKYYNFTIKENSRENSVIGQVKAIDDDDNWNAQVFYFLVATDVNRHYIYNDLKVEIKTGVILSNAILDHERIRSYSFYIRASSSPLGNKTAELMMMEDVHAEPSLAIVNVTVIDENDNASRFKKRMYFVGINWNAEPGREILTFESTDVDPSSQSNIQYALLSSSLLLDDFKEGGSVVPSPFRVDPNTGRLTISPSAMRQYGGGNSKFMVKVGLRETIAPYHQDTTQVKVWVVESSQEAILTIKTPPHEVPRDMLVELLGNITGRLVLINKITPHVGEGAKVKKEWSDIFVTPVDRKSSQIIPVTQFLQSLDLAHDRIRKSGVPIELHSAVPVINVQDYEGEKRESFDTAFAGLVALVALLCMGVATILAICCCLNRMYTSSKSSETTEKDYGSGMMKYPLHSSSSPGTPIMTRSIMGHQPEMMEEMATDNPLWIDHQTKSYEEQELTMQVASDLDNSNGTDDGMIHDGHSILVETHTLNRRNQNSPQFSHAYATLHPHPPDYDLLGGEDDTVAIHL